LLHQQLKCKKGRNNEINELTFLSMAITSSREDKARYDNSISSADIDKPGGFGREREMLKS